MFIFIDNINKKITDPIEFDDLKELNILDNFLKETLRLYSPSANLFTRKV